MTEEKKELTPEERAFMSRVNAELKTLAEEWKNKPCEFHTVFVRCAYWTKLLTKYYPKDVAACAEMAARLELPARVIPNPGGGYVH
jgi:hypothetical protein